MSLKVSALGDREILLVREFRANRELVFDALTRPELLKRWHGARGWNLVSCEVDLRVGGKWRFVSAGPGGERMAYGGIYLDVVSPERIVYTESFDDSWFAGESLVSTVLLESAGVTTMSSTVRYETREARDQVMKSPMERGAGESFDRLTEALAELEGERA
jgi:uncharacterized protein YndB with AHSA1/START domain